MLSTRTTTSKLRRISSPDHKERTVPHDNEENNRVYNEQKRRAQELRDSAAADQKRLDEINEKLNSVNPGRNRDSGGSSGSRDRNSSSAGCFVATAVFGSSVGPELDILRSFRDRRLLPSALGRLLVRRYYAIGPRVAAVIVSRPWMKSLVRRLLERLCARLDQAEKARTR